MNNKDKISFITCSGAKDFLFDAIKELGYSIFHPYKGNFFFFRVFREIWFRLHLPFESNFYNKKIDCKNKTIVVFDSLQRSNYIKWLRSKYPENKILFVYVNPVKSSFKDIDEVRNICDFISSDKQDCEDYGLTYDLGFYFDVFRMPSRDIKYDIFYIGRDKGRAEKLFELEEEFAKVGLSTELHITAPRRYMFWKRKPYYKPLIYYSEVLERTAAARAILMLSAGAQRGMTVRIFESVYNKKKLITDDMKIVNNEFYNENNFFILGKDDIALLPAFLDKPWHEYNSEQLEKYNFEKWVERIIGRYKD